MRFGLAKAGLAGLRLVGVPRVAGFAVVKTQGGAGADEMNNLVTGRCDVELGCGCERTDADIAIVVDDHVVVIGSLACEIAVRQEGQNLLQWIGARGARCPCCCRRNSGSDWPQ